jgi:tRNA dimethylallyltransferase
MNPVLCVIGPTAVGKTDVAVEICRRHNAEIVGVDASQIYRGMNIGTGKATAAELGEVRHHLIDVADPDDPWDAMRYVRAADAAIADIRSRGRNVVLCGGTGLWLRALLHGLCPAPPLADEIRATLRGRIAAGEVETLHAELAQVDAVAAARIRPQDAQRIERALGVYQTSGKALSAWQAEHGFGELRYPHHMLGLNRPRAALVARIEARVRWMFSHGFVPEVEALIQAGHGPHLRALSALGYRYIAAALAGETSMAQAQALTMIASRRYAKRQMTWFKKLPDVRWFEPPVDAAGVDSYLAEFWPPAGG